MGRPASGRLSRGAHLNRSGPPIIDTHCHLLPGLDDGPRSVDEAVALARQLVGAGVRKVVCTPHFSRRFPTTQGDARAALDRLRVALEEADVVLELSLGAEIGAATSLSATDEELMGRQLASGYILVELEPDTPTGFVELLLRRTAALGLRPVLAHPERSRALRGEYRVLDSARARGALLQIVAPSLVGRRGTASTTAAWRLVRSRRVDLLGSDSHRSRSERLPLSQALELLITRADATLITDITVRVPSMLLGDAPTA